MNKVLLNFGLLLDKYKLEERNKLFKDYQQFYYFPNYLPDSKSNTIYFFDDNDIDLIYNIFGSNVKIFYYKELYSEYVKHFKKYVEGVRSMFTHKNEYEILNDLQEVLNEYIYFYEYYKHVKSDYTFLSNSFRFYDKEPKLEKNWFYYNKILYSKDLKKKVDYDTAYGFFNIDRERYEKMIEISKEKFNKFFDNPDFDFDAERLRYDIFTELNLNPLSFRLKKTYYKNFKTFGKKPRLNKTQIGCSEIIKGMHDL